MSLIEDRFPPFDRQIIVSLARDGWSADDIAEHFGVWEPWDVEQLLLRLGLTDDQS